MKHTHMWEWATKGLREEAVCEADACVTHNGKPPSKRLKSACSINSREITITCGKAEEQLYTAMTTYFANQSNASQVAKNDAETADMFKSQTNMNNSQTNINNVKSLLDIINAPGVDDAIKQATQQQLVECIKGCAPIGSERAT